MQHTSNNLGIFNVPVEADIPYYFDRIKQPMDLGTVRSQLQRGHYESVSKCMSDIQLVFKNAMQFNAADNAVHLMAKVLTNEFETELKSLDEKCAKEVNNFFRSLK
jgi:hypothetical protein